jgi:transposase, IS5 family
MTPSSIRPAKTEEALHDIPLLREFAGLDAVEAIPDETTILKFRHLLERHGLAGALLEEINSLLGERGLILRKGTMVDAIAAPTSTKNAQGKRDPEMSSTKKGNQWYFGMKAHVGVDTAHGLVHTVVGTAAKVPDVKVTDTLRTCMGTRATRPGSATCRPATGPLWCFPFKRRPGQELPEWSIIELRARGQNRKGRASDCGHGPASRCRARPPAVRRWCGNRRIAAPVLPAPPCE